jgi:hypothetical protein
LRRTGIVTAYFTDDPDADEESIPSDFESVLTFAAPDLPRDDWATIEQLTQHPDYRLPPSDHPLFPAWTNRWRQQLGWEQKLGDASPRSAELALAAATDWIGEHRTESTFAWIDLFLAGAGWLPPSDVRNTHQEADATAGALRDPMPGRVGEIYLPEDVERVRCGWGDRLAYFDALLGAFLQGLEDAELGEIMFVLVAHSGEPLGEHGWIGPTPRMMYAEQLHAPLLVRWSGARAGVRQSAFVQAVDLYPTLLEAHAVEPPCSLGISLTSMLQGRSDRERWFTSSSTDGAQALETQLAKLVRQPAGPSELYLKPEDRWDLNNVASRRPEQVELMERTLQWVGKAV